MAEQFIVNASSSGERLDRFLQRSLPGITQAQIQSWIGSGAVRIRGKTCKPLRRIHRGDVVTLERPAPRAAAAPARPLPKLSVLLDHRLVVAVDKPAGWVVESAGPKSNVPSVVQALAQQLSGWDVSGRAEPGVVHRLDKETSGCLMVARTDTGVATLKAAFDAGTVNKIYLAVVMGTPPAEGRLAGPYGRDPKDPRRYTTKVRSARRASLRYRTLCSNEGLSLVEVTLETGRTHQIRVQFAEANWPVIGDSLYGTRESRLHPLAPGRQALHAFRLSFPLPGEEQRIALEAPVPSDLSKLLERVRAAEPSQGGHA